MFPSLPTLQYGPQSAQTRHSIIIDWPMKGHYLMHYDHLCKGPRGISMIPQASLFLSFLFFSFLLFFFNFEKGTDSGSSWAPYIGRGYKKKCDNSINKGVTGQKRMRKKKEIIRSQASKSDHHNLIFLHKNAYLFNEIISEKWSSLLHYWKQSFKGAELFRNT